MMDSEIFKEIDSHGPWWDKLHDGYFADPAVAGGFVEAIQTAVAASCPEVVVDLGGGTGFILSELIKHDIPTSIHLVNVDLSDKQLEGLDESRITSICTSIADFQRGDAGDESKRFLFIVRSALHYSGRGALEPLLRHLRSQMRKGEYFIHQAACFDLDRDARCVNMIYQRMGTGKWYPTVEQLSGYTENAGWSVQSISPAPSLHLTAEGLASRYGLTAETLSRIRKEIIDSFGEIEDVVDVTAEAFKAYLHYKIYVCVAD